MKGEYFAEETENCKILGKLMDNHVENLDDHGCPKIQELVDPKVDKQLWVTQNDTRIDFTADLKAKKYGKWTLKHFKL